MLYKLTNLTKVYGDRAVLDIEDLEIRPEKVYTLIGPNGAGKSTLLQILSFLDLPTKGSFDFLGQRVEYSERGLYHLRQKVVLMEQHPILFTGPVWKNVEYGLKIRKVSKAERIARVKEVLQMVGMERFINAESQKLSGGETKRIALARALAIEPKVMLCDEPTANVDTENQNIILRILERCNEEKKVSLIFATHYLSEAQRLADKTIVLENGRLSKLGRDNVFKVQFLRYDQESISSTWRIGRNLLLQVEDSNSVTRDKTKIHIAPEKIELFPHSSSEVGGNNVCIGTVKKIEKINGHVRLTVDCGVDLDLMKNIEDYAKNPVYIDETVILRITVEPAMFF